MPDYEQQLETLTRRLESLEEQNAELRTELEAANTEPAATERRRFDRRNLLRLGGAAAAVGAGSVLLRPGMAGAATGNMQFGAENAAAAASTGLASSNATDTLHITNSVVGTVSDVPVTTAVTAHATDAANHIRALYGVNDGLGDAIVGEVTSSDVNAIGSGVVGLGIDSGGVIGVSSGAGPGVGGLPFGSGPGVSGWSSSAADGVEAINDGTGRAAYSHIESTSNSKQATYSLTKGTGNAVLGQISHKTSSASAIKGSTNGKGAAVEGASSLGYGGLFSGAVQLKLKPSSHSTHPSTGSAGSLFVDSHGRLWYCKGGTSWKQLA